MVTLFFVKRKRTYPGRKEDTTIAKIMLIKVYVLEMLKKRRSKAVPVKTLSNMSVGVSTETFLLPKLKSKALLKSMMIATSKK